MTVSISSEQYDAWQAAAQFLVAKRSVIDAAFEGLDADDDVLVTRELLSAALEKLDALASSKGQPRTDIDAKASARGEVMRIHHLIAHYNSRALYHEDATKREVATEMVIQLGRRLAVAAKDAGLR